MAEGLAALPAFELLFADWLPEVVDDLDRVNRHLLDWELEVLCPEAQPCLPREMSVVADDVHFGVVEESAR